MTRKIVCIPVVLLFCCAVLAQDPASSAPANTAPTAVTSTSSPEIGEIQKIEDSWSNAVNARDQYALELVLSPLFVDVSATGDFTTRNQQLAQLITGEDKTMHLEQKVVTVRKLGDIAVANGTYSLHHRVGSAQVDEKGVFTHVFERQHGGWVCINSQRTLLREDASGKGKKKQSDSDAFHIPLFGGKKDQ